MARSMGGHHSAAAKSTTWLTPMHILKPLGPFDLDPCGREDWPTATTRYCLPQDGLALPWFGRVWLNPPYSANVIGTWLERLADHGRGIAMIFARTDTEAFFSGVWERAHACLFLRGRVYFHHADGTVAKDNGGAPSVLIGYGAQEIDALADSNLPGKLVLLRFPRTWLVASEQTWKEVVLTLIRAERTIQLEELYRRLRNHPKTIGRPNWQAKVRQTLQRARCTRVGRGTYTS